MTGDTENIVLSLLRDIRKEQAEQRSMLLDAFEYMRRIDSDVRRMTQRLEARISAVGTTHPTSKPETAGVRAGGPA